MSDLAGEAKFLKYFYTSNDSLLDKDTLKNESWNKYATKVQNLFLIPLGFQFWQIALVNNFEKAALYQKVKYFKILTFFGALTAGVYEKVQLEKYWLYLNRFYPEPT